jgi:superfamily I DNA/RNA helicase
MHWIVRNEAFKGQDPYGSHGWSLMADIKAAVSWFKTMALKPDADISLFQKALEDERFNRENLVEEILPHAIKCLQVSAEKTTWKGNTYHEYDIDDMQYKPFIYGWGKDICKRLFIDEGQDINPIRLELTDLWGEEQIIVVGDDYQTIYQFNGSMFNSLKTFGEKFDATALPLSVCWRCPSSHLDLARQLVPDIKDRPNCPVGTVNNLSDQTELQFGERGGLILSRTNANLVSLFYQLRKQGDRQCAMMSDKLADQLCNLFGSEYEVKNRIDSKWLTKYETKLERKLKYCKTESQRTLIEDNNAQVQIILAEVNPKTVGEAHAHIREEFSKPDFIDSDAALFSTAHGAKGLEHPNVTILGTSNFPHPKAQLEWERQAELNLKYVAGTRSLAEDDSPSDTGILNLIP